MCGAGDAYEICDLVWLLYLGFLVKMQDAVLNCGGRVSCRLLYVTATYRKEHEVNVLLLI